jgi:hypothetical protein
MLPTQSSPSGSGPLARLGRLALFVVLLNCPFWILSSHVFLTRATVSLDSLLGLLLLQYSALWGAVAIAVSWICDLTVSASFTYHFASPVDFFRSAAFANNIDWSNYLRAQTAISAAPFVVALLAAKRLQQQRIGPWPVVSTIALLLVLDTANGSSAFSRRDVRLIPTNIAGSSLHSIARAAFDNDKDSELVPAPFGTGGRVEFDHYLPSAASSGNSLLYVIVESLGVHQHPAVRHWLQRQLYPVGLFESYDLSVGAVVALGGTTSGEMRRLCGLQGSYRRLTPDASAACLPRLFGDAGWATVGLHGFSADMFYRSYWWPMIGLKDIRFAEQLTGASGRQCGAAFRGICDEDLIATAVRATDKQRTFVYALTLNSHLPVAPIDIPDDLAKICAESNAGDDVCTLLAHLGITLRAIANELGSRSTQPFVMLAGDHPPPFFEKRSRDQFLRDSVPLFALTPKRIVAWADGSPAAAR